MSPEFSLAEGGCRKHGVRDTREAFSNVPISFETMVSWFLYFILLFVLFNVIVGTLVNVFKNRSYSIFPIFFLYRVVIHHSLNH